MNASFPPFVLLARLVVTTVSWGVVNSLNAEAISPDDLAFFESKIRPILVESCYECHSAEAKKIKGGFHLDSKPGVLRGGDSGEVVVPGNTEMSRLLHMVRRLPDYEAMPPKTTLAPEKIELLAEWIRRGAPDPRLEEPTAPAASSGFNLAERKKWWSWQPVQNPATPQVRDAAWPANDYDAFVLASLEAKGWQPVATADRPALLRRLSFDLVGLAPTPTELQHFVNDTRPDAYARQVDRLLASPQFGEKWARHWMDLVRYAESKAFEMDYTMVDTFRYRDYLIQAFNEDVPFNQFILESLAGDLLPKPRRHPGTRDNESIKGSGYLVLTDGQHGPPDIHMDEARVFDGMIDVVSKTFLASTVACARCHDHKFDPITTADYYSMYGLLRSSRLAYANTTDSENEQRILTKLEAAMKTLQPLALERYEADAKNAARYLEARTAILENSVLKDAWQRLVEAKRLFEATKKNARKEKGDQLEEQQRALDKVITELCAAGIPGGLSPTVLANWVKLALDPELQKSVPELASLYPAIPNPKKASAKETSQTFAQITRSLDAWKIQGRAFDIRPPSATVVLGSDNQQLLQSITAGATIAGHYAGRITGAIRSPDFVLDGKMIRFQAKGRFASVRLVVRNYELTGRGPTTAKLYIPLNTDQWQTVEFDTVLWKGEPAYLEIAQGGEANHSIHPKEKVLKTAYDDQAYVAFRFEPAQDWSAYWSEHPGNSQENPAVARLLPLWQQAKTGKLTAAEADLLNAFITAGLIAPSGQESPAFSQAISQYRDLAQSLPVPRFARSLVDGDPQDTPVYVRGNHKNLSTAPNPRHFLDGLDGTPLKTAGSGRLEWANQVASAENPLTARVIVNRIWAHLFGRGIVATTNDFGFMSSPPSHPQLLDRLASDFVKEGWSIKSQIRKLVLTRTYQMATTPSVAAQEQDPANVFLQHMPVKRLEAEAVRDHILFCSSSLNLEQFGPSVPAYVNDQPDGRDKPEEGPLDGNGRRSVYLELRRNFLPSFLRTFDMPNATESTGDRPVTNVPAQSLALMNDPFVHEQARRWAEKLLAQPLSLPQRIDLMHQTAFARAATAQEKVWAEQVLQTMAAAYKTDLQSVATWTDLCHLIYNRKEFIYLF